MGIEGCSISVTVGLIDLLTSRELGESTFNEAVRVEVWFICSVGMVVCTAVLRERYRGTYRGNTPVADPEYRGIALFTEQWWQDWL